MKIRFIKDLIFLNFIYLFAILFCSCIWYEMKVLAMGFIFVPFMIFTVYSSIKQTKFAYIEYKTIKRLTEFTTIEEGLKNLKISKDMVKKLEEIDDILYANRINILCCEVIEKKLYYMGYTISK